MIMDIPLLFETKMDRLTHVVVVVWVDRATQETRLTKRDKSTLSQAQARINSQLPLDMKRDRADHVIDNSGSLQNTMEQVDKLNGIITRPLTWRELAFSRLGVVAIVVVAATLVSRLRS